MGGCGRDIGPPLPPIYTVDSSHGRGIPPADVEQWYGLWECRAATADKEHVVRFEPDRRKAGHFTGTYSEKSRRGRPRVQEIRGKWGMAIADDRHVLVGVYLDFVMGSSSRKLLLPFHRQVGDAYVGSDSDGVEYVTRNIRPARDGF